MRIIIKDKLLEANYNLKMTINEKPIKYLYEKDRFVAEIYDPKESDELNCYFVNAMFSERKSGLKIFLYWLLCIIGGTGEYGVFGVPYDLNLVILLNKKSTEDIVVTTNKYSAELPFSLEKGSCNLKDNKYIAVKGYTKKWILGKILPIFLLSLFAYIMIFLLVYVTGIIQLQVIVGVLITFVIFLFIKYVKNILNKNNS